MRLSHQNGALFAVVRIRNTLPTANHAAPFVRAVIAFVTDANQRTWAHVTVAHNAFAITLGAQATH